MSEKEQLRQVLEFCDANGLRCRVVGKWVWLKFENGKPSEELREKLKEIGFRWSPRRRQWAHNCGHSSMPAKGYKPWDKYETRSGGSVLAILRTAKNAGLEVA